MEEKELITKLQELRQIKPNQVWAFSVKEKILGEEKTGFSLLVNYFQLPYFRPAVASLVSAFLLFGTFVFSQSSVPGDFLYSVKKFTEKSQSFFVSEESRSQASLESANKRLEELAKVARTNRVKNLPSAITEVESSLSEAGKSLDQNSNPVVVKRMVEEMEAKVQEISSLGVVVDTQGLDQLTQSSDKFYAEYLVSDLATRTLLDRQQEVLTEMKELISQKEYSAAIITFETKFNQEEEVEEELETEEQELEEELTEEEMIGEEEIEEDLF